jgi:hypothetical protein
MDADLQNTMLDGYNESLRLFGQTVVINGIEVSATIDDNRENVKLVRGGLEQQQITEIVVLREDYETVVLAAPKSQVTIDAGNIRYLLDGVRSNTATPYVTLECVRHRK